MTWINSGRCSDGFDKEENSGDRGQLRQTLYHLRLVLRGVSIRGAEAALGSVAAGCGEGQ